MEKKIKFEINNGVEFYADEAAIMHNPMRFIMDFRNSTPRIDVRSQQQQQPIVVRHSVVLIDPYTAKSFLEELQTNINNYEKTFGKIKKPKVLEIAEKQQKKSSSPQETPTYFG